MIGKVKKYIIKSVFIGEIRELFTVGQIGAKKSVSGKAGWSIAVLSVELSWRLFLLLK